MGSNTAHAIEEATDTGADARPAPRVASGDRAGAVRCVAVASPVGSLGVPWCERIRCVARAVRAAAVAPPVSHDLVRNLRVSSDHAAATTAQRAAAAAVRQRSSCSAAAQAASAVQCSRNKVSALCCPTSNEPNSDSAALRG